MAALFGFAFLAFFTALMLREWLHLPGWTTYLVAILVPAATLGVYAVAVKLGERRSTKELNLASAPFNLAMGGLVGFVFIAGAVAMLWALRLNVVAPGQWRDPCFYLVFSSYISAILEELAFRAIILRLVARVFGPVAGLIISSILFALAHASYAQPQAVLLLVINGGLLLGILYMVSGSLWTAIGAHTAYDFTEWSIFGVRNKDGLFQVTPVPHQALWLTGDSFGPDSSILSAFVSLALIALVLRVARPKPSIPLDQGGQANAV